MNIIEAMEIPVKAIVDLDFAFRAAVSSGLLPADDPDIVSCRAIIAALAPVHDFHLAEDGFPRKGGTTSPAAAFALLANQPEAVPHIESLHQKMVANNIWLWKKGAIEEYLGIEGKNERAWANYKVRLYQDGCHSTLSDYDGTVQMLNWIHE